MATCETNLQAIATNSGSIVTINGQSRDRLLQIYTRLGGGGTIDMNILEALLQIDGSIREISGSSSGSFLTNDYLHDMTLLLSSMHTNLIGDLPDGLRTVV